VNRETLSRYCRLFSIGAYLIASVASAYVSKTDPSRGDTPGILSLIWGGVYVFGLLPRLSLGNLFSEPLHVAGMLLQSVAIIMAWASNFVYFYLVTAAFSGRRDGISLKLAVLPLLLSPGCFAMTHIPSYPGASIAVRPGEGAYLWMLSYALIAVFYYIHARSPIPDSGAQPAKP
jgi:hypothetical protein